MPKLLIVALCCVLVSIACCAPAHIGNKVTYTVTVQATNILNFDAANYDIIYNQSMVAVGSVGNGRIGSTVIPVVMWKVIKPRDIRIINDMPNLRDVSGSGYLARITFLAINRGTPKFSLSNIVLSNTTANLISPQTISLLVK